MMISRTVNYSSFRQELATWLDLVTDDHVPVKITRNSKESCVLMSESDYDALMESLYLLSNPKNAERLNQAIKDYNGGKTI